MKTYCISDVHGHMKNLEQFLSSLKEDDVVYVLGDVIDKGEDSIKCLLTVMNDRRCRMLLGNHEYMMYNALFSDIGKWNRAEATDIWFGLNDGKRTFSQFRKLDSETQSAVKTFISRLPLNFPDIEVNGRKFCLVHACPLHEEQEFLYEFPFEEDVETYVWERFMNAGKAVSFNGCTVIAGHTMCHHFYDECRPAFFKDNSLTENVNEAGFIDIDGNLAASGVYDAGLIALCLDDMTWKKY